MGEHERLIELDGKRAIVTGASRGIGRATAIMLARAGAEVGIADHKREDEAVAVGDTIRKLGRSAWSVGSDLGKPEGAAALFETCDREFGGLDFFVANAGIWPPEDVPLTEMSSEGWSEVMKANLDSVFFTVQGAARRLADSGRIIIVSSTASQRGEAGHSHYAASKGAINAFVKSLAVELAPQDITVNAVAPGWIDTDMATAALDEGYTLESVVSQIPLGRIGSADDVAGPIVFLCSKLARHITGEVFNVNGGSVLCG
jgi:3-oxoacyl-[acyl-carrier protein] reductase